MKITQGTCLFDPSVADSDVCELRTFMKETILPQPSKTQGVESKTKDVSLCKTVNRSEITTTYFHNIRSQLIHDVTAKTNKDPEYQQLKQEAKNKKITFTSFTGIKTCSFIVTTTSIKT